MKLFDWFKRTKPSQRKYEAARPTNIAGGFSSLSSLRSPVEDIRWELRGLIAHSRQQAQNNDYLKSYFDVLRRNVIGHAGIGLQMKSRNDNGALDKSANTTIEKAWTQWGKKSNCTLEGDLSWKAVQDVAVPTVARDGTLLVRMYRGASYGLHGFRIQLLEVDFLDLDLNQRLVAGGEIKMGVEFDSDGRRIAYHVFTRHPGEMRVGVARDRMRVPAGQVICIFRPERPGQVLGVPWAYSALRRLNMIRGYEEASITAARVGAATMGFYKPDVDTSEMDPAEITTLMQDGKGNLVKEMEPGMIETLPLGYDYKEHNPRYPTGEFDPFMKAMLRGASSGLGVSYATLTSDLTGANFSSLRAGKGEERDEWRCLQTWIAEDMHDSVFEGWLPMAMLSGVVSLPLSKLEKFLAPTWRPRGWAYVSPGEEATANQREMSALIRSPQQIVGERGEDLEDVFADIAEAKRLADGLGLKFNPQPPGHETGGQEPAKIAG